VEPTYMVSVTEYSKRHGIDRSLLSGIIAHYQIKPDAMHGKAKLFKPERLREILRNLDGAFRHDTSL